MAEETKKTARQGIIFDLDGTLLDTLEDLAGAMNTTLTKMGFPPHPVEKYKIMIGDGVENLARRVLPDSVSDRAVILDCVRVMKEEYSRNWNEFTRPYPGIPEMLGKLEKRNIPLAILTNKPHEFTLMMVSAFFPSTRFVMVLGDREQVPRKPDPAGALEIARAFEMPPGDFYFLGDTSTDMKTACAAGMVGVGALWGFRDAAELRENGARYLLNRPEEFQEILNGSTK